MDKFAEKKAKKIVIIIEIPAIICSVFLFYCTVMKPIEINVINIMCCILFIVINLMLPVISFRLFNQIFLDEILFKKSEETVLTNLSKDYMVEVIPTKNDTQYKNFVTVELVKRAKFYAKINENTPNKTCIYILFNGENEKILFENIDNACFAIYYKIED